MCPASKLRLVTEQLEDFEEFRKPSSGGSKQLDSDLVRVLYVPGERVTKAFMGIALATEPEAKAAISIKIPPAAIDKVAEARKLKCTLTMLRNKQQVNVPYEKEKEYLFSAFGAAERCEAIEEFLEQELDFAYLLENRVVEDHFHLHKATVVLDIQNSFDHYLGKLSLRMMLLDTAFKRYLQPLNMTVEYFGEKVAFEYAFLIHYTAWLLYASIGGVALFVVQAISLA